MTKSIFSPIFPLLQCKTSDGWQWIAYGSINLKRIMKLSFAQKNAHAEDWGRNPNFVFLVQPILKALGPPSQGLPSQKDWFEQSIGSIVFPVADLPLSSLQLKDTYGLHHKYVGTQRDMHINPWLPLLVQDMSSSSKFIKSDVELS